MAQVAFPSMGVSLTDYPSSASDPKKSKASQAIEILLQPPFLWKNIVGDIESSKSVSVSLGKKPVLTTDKKSYPIQTLYKPSGLLYEHRDQDPSAKLIATLNIKDALAKEKAALARNNIDVTDPAVIALQQSLQMAKKQKDDKAAIFVKDSSKLAAPKGNRGTLKPSPLSLKNHRIGLFDQKSATTKSLPASPSLPSLGGMTPVRAPDKKTIKTEALKRSLFHLLAVRAVSEKYILATLKCEASDLAPLLDKYGRSTRIDSSKYDLWDKGYKELDVWEFPYKTQEDRQAAIDRSISAFDRQRISVREPVWQILLEKSERNKGKILSKLKLHEGPVERNKPRINIQATGSSGTGNNTPRQSDDERDGRLAPSDANTRSRSQDPIKKKRLSEKEAQSKRVLQNKAANKTSDTKPKPNTTSTQVEERKAPAKKAAAKNPSAGSSKIKSTEYVHSSDDDMPIDEPVRTKTPAANGSTTKKPGSDKAAAAKKPPTLTKPAGVMKSTPNKPVITKKVIQVKKPMASKAVASPPTLAAASSTPKASNSSSSTAKGATSLQSTATKPRIPEKAAKASGMVRTLSHKRSGSSPLKPSPLGSSPPTNASELEIERAAAAQRQPSSGNSSSSTSPLINNLRRGGREDLPRIPKRTSPVDGSASDRGLKRKANDLDSDIHEHKVTSATVVPPSSDSDATVGIIAAAVAAPLPVKRRRSTPESLGPSSGSASDAAPAMLERSNIEYSRMFKQQADRYNAYLKELQDLDAPPQESIERLHRMHGKLVAHKREIWKLARP